MSLIIPGKTFLVGEYSALVGGSVLGLATGPGFQINYSSHTTAVQDFSMNSPAGLYVKDHSSQFENLKIDIVDGFAPHGGFGKSTAEFLSVEIKLGTKTTSKNFEAVREKYVRYSQKSGAEVSGLDLAIQYFGGVTHFDSQSEHYGSGPWAYPDHDFLLVSTGHKVKTHEHIQTLSKPTLLELKPIAQEAIASYFKDISEFIAALKIWSSHLEQLGFLTKESKELKSKLESDPDILCVKPCGAMGADVLFVLCEKEKSQALQKKIHDMKLKIQATSKDLMAGVQSNLKLDEQSSDLSSYVD